MKINSKKQQALGIAGLALLRNWLVGNNQSILHTLKEISYISKKVKNTIVSNKVIIRQNVQGGYGIWSKTYDTKTNLLIEIEEPVVRKILQNIAPCKVLDAACGTGRYANHLKKNGFKVVGLDISKDMLHIAKKIDSNINYVHGDLRKLPFKNNGFDLVVSGLGLNQIKDIKPVINEFSRVVRVNGKIIISSIHPLFNTLGSHAEFYDNRGNKNYIKNIPHWHGELINLFKDSGLEIISCLEPKLTNRHLSTAVSIYELNSKKTVEKALLGLPVALVWELKKFKGIC